MKPVLLIAASLALSPLAAAQTPLDANTVYELPSLTTADGKADHETIAINSQGDVLVVWSSSIYSPSSANAEVRRIECAFLRRTSATGWDLYPTQTLAEADPTKLPGGSIFPGGDICRKADVTSVGDDFAVVWQRIEIGDTNKGRLEAALIEVPASGNAVYHLEATEGVGWELDTFDPRIAGGMVDIACAPGTTSPIAAAYVHFTGKTNLGGIEWAYDFDLRALTFDFPVSGAPPHINPPNVLGNIPFDDASPNDLGGGRILPDIVWDSWGNLVVATEKFARGERLGNGAADEGKILLRRYSVDGSGAMILLNHKALMGTDPTYSQRRPNLFRSPSNNAVSLTWAQGRQQNFSTSVFHVDARYADPVKDPTFVNHAPAPLSRGINPQLPIPLQFKGVRGLVIVNGRATQAGYDLNVNNDGWVRLFEFSGKHPWRPSLDVLENDPLRPPGHGILVFGMEGRITTIESRILIEIMPL
ncbi:MAG: hypothetical protein MK209_00585 [Planctomycetes bacterium]|nr:hypothetical protein [Planctomycetota bacterium]